MRKCPCGGAARAFCILGSTVGTRQGKHRGLPLQRKEGDRPGRPYIPCSSYSFSSPGCLPGSKPPTSWYTTFFSSSNALTCGICPGKPSFFHSAATLS